MVENRQPTSVTDAQEAADKDYRQRVRRYTISMIIRVVCLLLAFVFSGWLRWVLLGGAVVLPYMAVVIANSRNERLINYEMARMQEAPSAALNPEAMFRPDTWQENDDHEPIIIGEVLGESPGSQSESPGSDASESDASESDDQGEGAHGR